MIKKETSNSGIIIKSVLIGTGLFFLSVFLMGGGHGSFLPAKLFFPYTMLSTAFTGSINGGFIVVALIQFPSYGILIVSGKRYGYQNYVLGILIAIHILALLLSLNYSSETFD